MILYSYFTCESAIEKNKFDELLKLVPESVRRKVLSYRRWQDQQTCLIGKLLTRALLIRQGYSEDCLKRLEVNAYGKPFIDAKVDFNVSHSGGLVVIALSDTHQVGVDVERNEPFDSNQPPYEAIDTFLRPEERENLQRIPTSEAFYEFWTKKESLMKAKGMGLSVDLKDIYIDQDQAVYQSKGKTEAWHYYSLQVPPGYTATLCIQERGLLPQFLALPDLLAT